MGDCLAERRNTVEPGVDVVPLADRLDSALGHGSRKLCVAHPLGQVHAPDPVALAEEIVRRGLNVRATERLVQRRAKSPPPAKRPPRDADTVALERELAAVLGLRVTLEPKKRGGALTLHYASLDQLDAVLRLLRAS